MKKIAFATLMVLAFGTANAQVTLGASDSHAISGSVANSSATAASNSAGFQQQGQGQSQTNAGNYTSSLNVSNPVNTTSTSQSNSGGNTLGLTSTNSSNSGNNSLGNTSTNENSNGNSSQNKAEGNSTNVSFDAPKLPVNTAYAPSMQSTAPCAIAVSGGFSIATLSVSGGSAYVLDGCQKLEEYRVVATLGGVSDDTLDEMRCEVSPVYRRARARLAQAGKGAGCLAIEEK